MQKLELGFDLRLTSTWTEVTRGWSMASFSAWHVNCDPRSPRLSEIRTSLRPVPVPSSSSKELTLPTVKESTCKKEGLIRGHQLFLPEITLEPLNQVTRGMGLPPEDWQIRRSSWPSLKGPMIALPEMSLPSAVDTVRFLGSAVRYSGVSMRYVICNTIYVPSVVNLTSWTTGQSLVMSKKVISHLYSPSSLVFKSLIWSLVVELFPSKIRVPRSTNSPSALAKLAMGL